MLGVECRASGIAVSTNSSQFKFNNEINAKRMRMNEWQACVIACRLKEFLQMLNAWGTQTHTQTQPQNQTLYRRAKACGWKNFNDELNRISLIFGWANG